MSDVAGPRHAARHIVGALSVDGGGGRGSAVTYVKAVTSAAPKLVLLGPPFVAIASDRDRFMIWAARSLTAQPNNDRLSEGF